MGYEGPTLKDMIDQLESATKVTGRDMADAMVDHGMRVIKQNTPVKTFHLRESYERTEIVYHRYPGMSVNMYAWTGRVYTEVEYAPYMERGTGLWGPRHKKYIIRPKKPGGVLKFAPYERMPNGAVVLDVSSGVPTKSGMVYTRFVLHPGSPGHHMFQIGATLTEAEYNEWSLEPLRLWKASVEHKLRAAA